MGAVLQFAKVQTGDDWTPSERVQLREIWSQLTADIEDLEVVFGKSDLGDPWCVIGDESGDVMLHVARISGEFVVHSTAADTVAEGFDLWNTVARLLGSSIRDRRGEVLSFPSDSATASAIALFLSIALAGEMGHLTDDFQRSLGAMGPPKDEVTNSNREPTPSTGASEATRHDESRLQHEAPSSRQEQYAQPPHPDDQAAHGHASNSPEPSAAEASRAPLASTPPRANSGEAEAPMAANAPPPTGDARGLNSVSALADVTDKNRAAATGNLLVEGGDGADRLQLSARWVTAGADGADVFVAEALNPAPAETTTSDEPRLLGVVADLIEAQGDRLEFSGGATAIAVGTRLESDVLAHLRNLPAMSTVPEVAGRRIDFDLDGDGTSDAFLLVADSRGGWLVQIRNLSPAHGDAVGVIGPPGASFGHASGGVDPGYGAPDSPFAHQVPILVPLPDPYPG